jgi:PHP family Zn ribbon phosphoesterase
MTLDEIDTLSDLKLWLSENMPTATLTEGEGGITISTGLESTMGGYLSPIEGKCDKCASSYELSDKDNRCGDCGNCSDCCTHEREGK